MKPVHFEYLIDVVASPRQAWEVFSNTDKLNRSVGLPPVSYSKMEGDPASFRLNAESSMMGLKLRWDELPFEWVGERFFAEERLFRSGPMREVKLRLDFLPQGSGTRLKVSADIEPSNVATRLLVQTAVGRKIKQDFQKVANQLNKFVAHEEDSPLPQTKAGNVNAAALAQRVQSLVEAFPQFKELAERLARLLREGFDSDVLAIRPFELADQWKVPRKELLGFFLQATRSGLLDLRWTVMCPTCKIVKAQYSSLGKIKPTIHCDGCKIEYNAEFDRSVEARFDAHPAIRRAKDEIYCIGGPANAPHVYAQFYLRPGDAKEVSVVLPARNWKLRAFGVGEKDLEAAENGGGSTLDLEMKNGGLNLSSAKVKAGEVRLRLKNSSSKEAILRVEEENWKEKAATAAYVTALPQFRDLFSSEVLAPDQEIAVRNLAVLFTDLQGSTAFYRAAGDAKAYTLVRSHFDYLSAIVEKYDGFLVKTMGDAIVAVFFSALEAVRAAVEIQRGLPGFNAKNKSAFVIKLGIHEGPLIAVNANGRMDYFGSTMNIGARLEKESRGGDFVVTQAVAENPSVKQFLSQAKLKEEKLTVPLRGIDQPFQLLRLTP